jgi:hypothetical protein
MGQKGSREAQEAPPAQDGVPRATTAAPPQEDASPAPAPAPAPVADFTQDSSDDEPPAKRAKKAAPAPSGSAPSTVRAPPPVILTGGIERTSDRNNRLFLTFMQDHPRVGENDLKDLSYYKILCGCRFDGFRGDTLGNALEHFVSPEWKEMPNEWKEAQERKDFRVVMQTTSKLLADADLEPNVSLERKGGKPEERMRVRIVMMHPFMVASAFKLWPFDPEWKDL